MVVGREGIEPPQSKTADLQSAELTTCSTYPRRSIDRCALPTEREYSEHASGASNWCRTPIVHNELTHAAFLRVPTPARTTHEELSPMHRWNPRTRLVRGGLIAIVLSMGGALVAYASLPSAADDGQARAALGAANGQAEQGQSGEHPAENTADGQSTALDQLTENQGRLFATLGDALTRLSDNDNVPDAATNAVQNVIDMLGGDIGLNRAMGAVGGDTGAPDLPEAATNHPSKP
jgi:hypothetical protein